MSPTQALDRLARAILEKAERLEYWAAWNADARDVAGRAEGLREAARMAREFAATGGE